MLSVSELTELAIESLNEAVGNGLLLVRGETGVHWEKGEDLWAPDGPAGPTPQACDVGGALLLKSPGRAHLHRGDADRALRDIVDPAFYLTSPDPDLDMLFHSPVYELLRNFFHGWDNLDFVGGSEEAYEAGFYLAKQYYPLDYELLVQTRNPSP